jgi:phosphatidylserine synthase
VLDFVRWIFSFFSCLVSFSLLSSFSFPSLPLSRRTVDDQFYGFPLFLLFRLRFGVLHSPVSSCVALLVLVSIFVVAIHTVISEHLKVVICDYHYLHNPCRVASLPLDLD